MTASNRGNSCSRHLFVIAMEISKTGLELANDFALERDVHTKKRRAWMDAAAHRNFEPSPSIFEVIREAFGVWLSCVSKS